MGVDVGATLCKLAYRRGDLETARGPSTDGAVLRTSTAAWRPDRIGATGGGALRVAEATGRPVQVVGEFEAWAAGARLLAADDHVDLPPRFLLVSLGTGTSILSVVPDAVTRVGGTALGGGTVVGLGRLLAGVTSFDAISALATEGDRRRVDLLVGDVYREAAFALPGDLTASSFAKLASDRPADLAHALMGLVGENVALLCAALARQSTAAAVVYCGSTLERNPALVGILREVTTLSGQHAVFLSRGAYCGAIGAAALAVR